MIFNQTNKSKTILQLALLSLMSMVVIPATAAPILKPSIKISSAVVTIGDMFDNAGINAESALFRSPAPGTTGTVSLQSIRQAAAKVGLLDYGTDGIYSVSVSRTGFLVETQALNNLIIDELKSKGILSGGVFAKPKFSTDFTPTYSTSASEPAQLKQLNYTPSSNRFSAIFQIAGEKKTHELAGTLNLMIEVPHLKTSLNTGAIILANNIEMLPVAMRYAQNSGFATLEQIIGKQLLRPTRAGMLIRPSDIIEPEIVKRSQIVTLYFKKGPLTLTASGQALNSAAKGEIVSVLNTSSKQIVRGIATKSGAVEIINNAPNIRNTKG